MKTKKQNKSRKRIIAFLLMLSLVMTSGTFAYWASYVEGTSTEATGTLEVGSGDEVSTRFDLSNEFNSGGYLVPEGQVENSQEETAVEEINLSFDVEWVEDEETTQMLGVDAVGEINISHEVSIVIDGEKLDQEEYAHIYELVNVHYAKSNAEELKLDAKAETFNFTITLDEPADQAEYNLIANAEISVTFTYTIDTDEIVATDQK